MTTPDGLWAGSLWAGSLRAGSLRVIHRRRTRGRSSRPEPAVPSRSARLRRLTRERCPARNWSTRSSLRRRRCPSWQPGRWDCSPSSPGRDGPAMSPNLVAELMDKGGQGRRPDGEIDLDTVDTLVQERAASLAAAEVAAALQISPITAGSRVRKAQDLCDGLPATVNALAAGRIDRGRAWLIAERTAPLSPSLREAVQDRILPIAEDRSAGNLRGLLDRAVIAADPHAAENRERKAKHDRELVLRSLPDGMASVRAFAPADAAMSIFTLADLLADRTGTDDDRPVAARRVDDWHAIAQQLLTHGYVDLTDLLDEVDGSGEPGSTEGISGANDEPDQDSFTERDSAATPATSHPVPDPPSGSSDHGDPANAQATSHPVPEAPSGSSGHGGAAATS